MQKIHEQRKLFIGNKKITEICYRHYSNNAKQIITIKTMTPI